MGLRGKVAVILALGLGIIISGTLAVHHRVILPQLRAAEARADHLNVRRVELGFELVRTELERLAYDYAIWDDNFDYLNGAQPDFIAANFSVNSMLRPDISGVAIFLGDDTPMFHAETDRAAGRLRETPHIAATELLPMKPATFPADTEPPSLASGVTMGSQGPMLFAAFSVKRSNERGDSPGWLVFYRLIDASFRERIEQLVNVEFTAVEPAAPGAADTAYRDAQGLLYWTLRSSDGRGLQRFAVRMPPSVVDQSLMPVSVQAGAVLAVLVFVLILLLLNLQVLRPVARIVRHLGDIRRSSNYALRLQPRGSDELAVLGRECDSLITYVEQQQSTLRDQAQSLLDLSHRDALTGLANRRLFDEMLLECWSLARRSGKPLALLMCDLDAFKAYNDTLGHPAGDAVLARFGGVLRSTVIRQSDLACRYGGEEFVLLLPDADASGAETAAQRIHARLAEENIPHPASPVAPRLTVSIGIAILDPASEPALESSVLIARADEALYAAKHAGRNRTVIYRKS